MVRYESMRTSEQAATRSDYTPWRATTFYIPLLLQAVSQSLTYPLVAAIVSHGEHGVVELAAFAQGQAVMFVIGALGSGLLTTGMVLPESPAAIALATAEGLRAHAAAIGVRLAQPTSGEKAE